MYLEDEGDFIVWHIPSKPQKKLKKNGSQILEVKNYLCSLWEDKEKKRACVTLNIQGPQIMNGAINNIGHNFKG